MTTYALRLHVRYVFDRPTGNGRQLFRVLPADVIGLQRVRNATITLTPDSGEQGEFTDFFGTRVIEIAMPAGLTRLDLEMTATVERMAKDGMLDLSTPLADLTQDLASVHDVGARSPHHFLPESRRIPTHEPITAFAHDHLPAQATTRAAIEALGQALHRHMTFDAQATGVDTSPAEAFAQARGVCQDFAQIMVGGLRSLGVPAAYVAGYLRTDPPPGKPRLAGADAMHAWVRAWAGAEVGWVDYDPTNACFALNDHIDVGFGRDYGDVAPVTGMLWLDGTQTGSHSVDITSLPDRDFDDS